MRCVSKRLLSATVCALVALPQVNGVEKPGGGKPSDKVLQYLSALEKRPSPGYVFDRLYDAWLDTGSAEELQTYLAARVQAKSQANDMLLLAFLHRKEGRDPAALALLKQATTADPQHTSAWYYRAEVESGMLDFDAALNSVQTSATLAALSKMSDDDLLRRIVALQGRLLIRCGKRDQALVVWRSLVARKSGDFAEEIVDLAAAEGLLPEAIQDQKTLLAASDDPYVTVRRSLRLAELLGQANQRAEALAVLDQTLEKVAAGAWLEREILAAIERLYRRDDDIAGLSTHLGRLAQGSATRQGLRRRQAILLMETGRLEEAIAVSATIMAVHPGERRYVQEHAQLLLKAGKPEDAATVLESLIAADPKDASLLIRLAEVRQQLAKPEEVKALVKRFAALEEGTLASLQRIARTYERFTCIPEAEAIWRQAVKEHPTDAQAKEDLAAHLYRFEKKPEAIALWQEMAATDAAGLLRAARALASRGEHLQAFTMLEARREQHADQEAWFSLYIQEAIIADKAAQAQWAGRRWVQLAQDVRSLEQAIESCLRLAIRTQSVSVLIAELKALQNLSIRERCLLAWAYEHDNQAGSADALLFDAALSNEALILSSRFRLQRLRQDWAAAAQTLEAMLKLPEKTKAQTLRDVVEMHIRAGNHEAALTWIAQWRRSVPGSIETWLVESRLYQVLGKTEESLAVLRRGVSVLQPARNCGNTWPRPITLRENLQSPSGCFGASMKMQKPQKINCASSARWR
jgi:predicted Zn-dependent protease